MFGRLVSNNLYEDAFITPAVKLTIEDLFPWAKVEFSAADCHYHFTTHYLPFMMSIAIVLPSAVVMIPLRTGIVRRQPFQPTFVIFVKTRLIVIDKDARRNVHCVNQTESLNYAALLYLVSYFASDVDETHSVRNVKAQMFRVGLHKALRKVSPAELILSLSLSDILCVKDHTTITSVMALIVIHLVSLLARILSWASDESWTAKIGAHVRIWG